MRFVILAILCLIMVLSGCNNEPVVARGTTAQERQGSVVLTGENRPVFLDQELAEQIRIVDIKVTRNDMGMLVVASQLQTVVDSNVAIDAKCRFTEKDGTVEDTPWTPFVIRRHEINLVKFTSLSPEVVKYSLYFRFTR